MYTGGVVTVPVRCIALVLALLFAATPVLAGVCEIDCEQRFAASACHQSTTSPDGPMVRGAQHACDHGDTTGSPASLAGASARDSIGTLVALQVPTLAHASVPGARVATAAALHGPPDLSGRSTSSHITALRI